MFVLTLDPTCCTANSTVAVELSWCLLDFFEAVHVENPSWKLPLADVCRVNDAVGCRRVAAVVAPDAAAAVLPLFWLCKYMDGD